MLHFLRFFLAVAAALAASLAHATFHTFRIDRVYSNADGTIQFVVLRESSGLDGENLWQGHALTSTHAGQSKSFTFPANLPGTNTAGRQVLVATPAFAALGIATPDYTIPAGFLPTDGGTLDFAGVSQMTFAGLPTDGNSELQANGTVAPNVATNFAGASGIVPALPVTAVEFYNAALDHYFISALQPDIDALDSGRFTGWVRTGEAFKVYPTQAAGGASVNPVCRIYIPPAQGDSHFFSASPQECDETRARFPTFTFESPAVFFVALPVTTPGPTAGTCATGTIPVYRTFDNRVDANHRYTTSRAIRDQMVGRGYIAEGYGDDAVIMCAPA